MNRIRIFIADKNKKSYFKIAKELIYLTIRHKELPRHYFGKFLYRTEISNPSDYLTMKEFYKILYSPELHNPDYATLFKNKLIFSLYLEQFNMPQPKTIGYNIDKLFIYKDERKEINSVDTLHLFFKKIMEDNFNKGLFIKPLGNMGGKNCYLLNYDSLGSEIEALSGDILSNNFIFQYVIEQHPDINKIYSKSINTVRFDTYIDNSGKINILSALMRFGTGGSNIDNVSGGGFSVGIDLKKEVLKKRGIANMKNGTPYFYEHPDTGFILENASIPFLKEACKLVIDATDYLPDRLIGWDVAITPSGPIIVEGNNMPSTHMTDISYQGYRHHPLFKEILSLVN